MSVAFLVEDSCRFRSFRKKQINEILNAASQVRGSMRLLRRELYDNQLVVAYTGRPGVSAYRNVGHRPTPSH